ncbi:DUF6943 family protein [Chitinophaga varians]|uniref:DUF6943 family protein n=1 Tax=Chitinophaga varians TaxID=2202339 RepID=UPI00165FB631|nr:hypothetical protein [Chitinophaga varians]MBC9909127.1 hypothetical protein [Chitinophaga varians]
MKDFKLVTYNSSVPPKTPPAFYILSRGITTGKPGLNPWRNSLCFYCNPEDAPQYYRYVYCIWSANIFRHDLPIWGIPYLTIKEMYRIIAVTIGVLEGVDAYIGKLYLLMGKDITKLYRIAVLESLQLVLMQREGMPSIINRSCGRKGYAWNYGNRAIKI